VVARPRVGHGQRRLALGQPVARVSRVSTARPWRFSIIACQLCRLPRPLLWSRASGSLVEACVSVLRFSP